MGVVSGANTGVSLSSVSFFENFGAVSGSGKTQNGGSAGVEMPIGGTVHNAAGATIQSNSDAIHMDGPGTVTNEGTIDSSVSAVYLGKGGTFTNNATSSITGVHGIVMDRGTNNVAVNHGTISGSNEGALFRNASESGTLLNDGTITGRSNGIKVLGASQQIINRGTIAGTSGAAILLSGDDNNTVILDTGSVLVGNVNDG
jgi:hypothetical protein